jgi:pimeloyl-ACP methyl ester carboxylesterase
MNKNFIVLSSVFLILACNDAGEQKGNKSININNVSIAYEECGTKDTTLLFVHGWGINKEYWDAQQKYFCNNYKVVAIDLPGFGNSGKNRTAWTFEQYADDINEFIKAKELKNVILIGHSMSGDIVLLADTKYPDRLIGIVGIDNLHVPGIKYNEEQLKQNDSFFMMLETQYKATVGDYTSRFLFPPNADSVSVNRVINDIRNSDSVISVKVIRALAETAQSERDMMQQLRHKLYLVNSDMYPTQLDTLRKYCKASADVVYVKGTGHYPMIEKPAEFNAALEKVIHLIGRN